MPQRFFHSQIQNNTRKGIYHQQGAMVLGQCTTIYDPLVSEIRRQHNGGIKDASVGQVAQLPVTFMASQFINHHRECIGKIPKD